MGFKMGIVGLPNVGKSTLFNALTRTAAAQAANFPFCTIEPNVGEVAVPDPRLDKLAAIAHSKEIIPTRLTFVDIAGLVRGASKGEGLGNQFLANIRECDAIAHVLRCFEDGDVTHVEGRIDPIADAETWVTSPSSKQRSTWAIASHSRMLARNWLPSPSPLDAPRTSPAMSTKVSRVGMISFEWAMAASFSSRGSGTATSPTLGSMVQNGKVRGLGGGGPGQGVEKGRLAHVGKPDDAHLETQFTLLLRTEAGIGGAMRMVKVKAWENRRGLRA